ncbi:hypothetical protein [Pantoea sp. PNA 03-3]|uniref:hypothetical protein n=1 Tax=Pantoea sp. PNA 03-3 TaxID=2135460 RepID=UPI000D77049B|nr:hypothetical protein [Pantoea sp. PNA 03-3]PXV70919.1 hypothetical protein C7433_11461 [Pantoea sp. PNA 03-3]
MGTTIQTCAEKRTPEGWKQMDDAVFPRPPSYIDAGEPAFSPEPFNYQSYGMFALFAGVRNRSNGPVLSTPRGFPEDITESALLHLVPEISQIETGCGYGGFETELPDSVADRIAMADKESYGHSWLSAAELLAFDYDRSFTDVNAVPPLETTCREFLGEMYFIHLEVLRELNAAQDMRILFCFCG